MKVISIINVNKYKKLMKILLIIALIVLTQSIAFATDWDIIKVFEKSNFISLQDSTIHSIDMIREYDTGDGIEYYNYYSPEITSGTVQNPKCVIFQGAGWLGRKILIKKEGKQFFQNYENKLIQFNITARLNDKWQLTKLKYGNYIEAEVIALSYKTVLPGISDSVKIIKLTEKNNQDSIVDSPINNLTFELSKNYGLTLLYNMYFFPNTINQYRLAGIENLSGITPIKFKDVFDFQINDEFHIYEGETSASDISILTWRRIRIIDKNYIPEKEIYDYEVENKVMQVQIISNKSDTIYNNNFVHLQYKLNDYTDYQPEQSYLYTTFNDTLLTSNGFLTNQYGGRQVIQNLKIYQQDTPPCFIKYQRQGFKFYSYIEGCGDFFEQDLGYGHKWRRLVYYNKQGKKWGKPLDFIVSINNNPPETGIHLINEILTADENLQLYIQTDGYYQIHISSLNGIQILNQTLRLYSGKNSIKLAELSTGTYFIFIQKGKQIFKEFFVVIK